MESFSFTFKYDGEEGASMEIETETAKFGLLSFYVFLKESEFR